MVDVFVEVPGASPAEVEQRVTRRMASVVASGSAAYLAALNW